MVESPMQNLEKFDSPNADQARIISFEGIEGSGKSTQIKLAKTYLESVGKKVSLFREPGSTHFSEGLREVMLGQKEKVSPLAQALLFACARAQLLEEKIWPLLNDTQNVIILDRYIDSSLAYQGSAAGLGMQTILDIHTHAPLNLLPNKTLYLRIDQETSFARQAKRGQEKDYFESQKSDFYQKLIDGYELAASTFTQRVKTIDAQLSESEVHNQIRAVLDEVLS